MVITLVRDEAGGAAGRDFTERFDLLRVYHGRGLWFDVSL